MNTTPHPGEAPADPIVIVPVICGKSHSLKPSKALDFFSLGKSPVGCCRGPQALQDALLASWRGLWEAGAFPASQAQPEAVGSLLTRRAGRRAVSCGKVGGARGKRAFCVFHGGHLAFHRKSIRLSMAEQPGAGSGYPQWAGGHYRLYYIKSVLLNYIYRCTPQTLHKIPLNLAQNPVLGGLNLAQNPVETLHRIPLKPSSIRSPFVDNQDNQGSRPTLHRIPKRQNSGTLQGVGS